MVTPDRVLRTLVFPIQYPEIGETLARELGQDVEKLYEACGIDLPRPFTPFHAVTHHGRRADETLPDAVHVGKPGRHAPWWRSWNISRSHPTDRSACWPPAQRTWANLGEALQGALRYAPLVVTAFQLRREDLGDEAYIVAEPSHDFSSVHDFFAETVMLAFANITPLPTQPIVGASVWLRQLSVGDPASSTPICPHLHEGIVDGNIRFRQDTLANAASRFITIDLFLCSWWFGTGC